MIADFLKPPTDNLYKFMCVCGLILVLISITFPPWQLNKSVHSFLENRRDLRILQVDFEELGRRHQILSEEGDDLIREGEILVKQMKEVQSARSAKGLTQAEKLEFNDQMERLKSLDGQAREKENAWIEKDAMLRSVAVEKAKKLAEMTYKHQAAQWDFRSGIVLTILAIFTAALGFWLGRKGFNLWSSRVQVFEDAILKKQAESATR